MGISRRAGWLTVLFFVISVGGVSIGQGLYDFYRLVTGPGQVLPACPEWGDLPEWSKRPPTENLFSRIRVGNRKALQKMQEWENRIEETSFLRPMVSDFLQPLYRWLGLAGENALIGADGWLYYHRDVRLLTDSGRIRWSHDDPVLNSISSVVTIQDFARQLAQRGISLLVMPTPSKASIEPEYLWKGFSGRDQPLFPPGYIRWAKALQDSGIEVVDIHTRLMDRKRETGEPQYLKTDTHWTPDAMAAAAHLLAERVQGVHPGGMVPYVRKERTVTGYGDIAAMIDSAGSTPEWAPETVTIHEVLGPEGEFWRETPSAGVLLLGDSFSNIYSMESMNWGRSGGLAEMVSYYLREPVDRIVRNDAGAISGRRILSRELAAGKDRLAGKKLVIWQFAARELAFGDWSPITLKLGVAGESPFLAPGSGESWLVSGTVSSLSAIPSPGSVPYADHIASIHLVDIRSGNPPLYSGQALVYIRSMEENRLTPAAGLRAGDRICIRLQAWSDVESRMGGFNRSEPEDDELLFAQPCWGELVRETDGFL